MSVDRSRVTAGSVARMAGNIASGMMANRLYYDYGPERIATVATQIAYLIVDEVEKVETFAARYEAAPVAPFDSRDNDRPAGGR